jgi:predicted nucleic acid-binding protein
MKICVDTTILIDILKDEFRDFQNKFYLALEMGEELTAPSIVYAELMSQFKGNSKLLDEFLREHKINITSLDISSAIASANGWMKYLKRKVKVHCPQCDAEIGLKLHVLSDFYIGGFAVARCDAILTRDRGIYKKYFPDLPGYEGCLK